MNKNNIFVNEYKGLEKKISKRNIDAHKNKIKSNLLKIQKTSKIV